MFYIIIGQSGAGKTTFAKTNFLQEPAEVVDDILPLTKCQNGVIGLGRYYVGKRTEGTDTLSYNAKNKIKQQLKKLAQQKATVVLEGDRINNREIFDYISTLGVNVKLYLIKCRLETSMKRLRAAGSTITPTFVKTTKTKSARMYLDYAAKYKGEIITTDEKEDKPE